MHAETPTVGRTFGSAFVKQNQSQTTVKAMKIDFPQELLHRSQHPSGLPSEPGRTAWFSGKERCRNNLCEEAPGQGIVVRASGYQVSKVGILT